MKPIQVFLRILMWIVIILFQWIMTQVVTFLVSMLFPSMSGDFENGLPAILLFILGICFSVGAFLAGRLVIQKGWIKAEPRWSARFTCTLAGAYLPLVIAMIVYQPVEPGNPYLFVPEFACIAGFFAPSWIQ